MAPATRYLLMRNVLSFGGRSVGVFGEEEFGHKNPPLKDEGT